MFVFYCHLALYPFILHACVLLNTDSLLFHRLKIPCRLVISAWYPYGCSYRKPKIYGVTKPQETPLNTPLYLANCKVGFALI